jgi:HEAT repeat protein
MTDESTAPHLVETARTTPDAVDPADLALHLETGTATERGRLAAAIGHLELAGRDVAPCYDSLRELYDSPDALAEPVRLSVAADDGWFQPRAAAFATAALVLTGAVDADAWLPDLVDAHRGRYPEFDADIQTYTAVREVGWALASVVIYADGYARPLLRLLDADADLLRRVGAAALSAVAEEHAPIRGRLPDTTSDIVTTLAERLAVDPHPRVRYHAVFGLHEFGLDDPDAITGRAAALRNALDDQEPLVRMEAAGALAVAGVTDAVDGLRDLSASDPDRRVREAAEEALAKLVAAE